jgi:hypothetical protein
MTVSSGSTTDTLNYSYDALQRLTSQTTVRTGLTLAKEYSYKYGADGLRTQKTVGSTVYNYYYADGLLVCQTWGNNYIDFLYDESGGSYSYNGI